MLQDAFVFIAINLTLCDPVLSSPFFKMAHIIATAAGIVYNKHKYYVEGTDHMKKSADLRSLKTILVVLAFFLLSGCAKNKEEAVSAEQPAETAVSTEKEEAPEEKVIPEEEEITKEEAVPVEEAAETEPAPEVKKEKPYLMAELLKETGAPVGDVAVFRQEDLDGDGEDEAFALIGKMNEDSEDYGDFSLVEGEIWFVGKNGAKKIHDNGGMGFSDRERTMTLGDTKYILFDEVYVSDNLTDAWYVADGDAVEAPFTGRGYVMTNVDGENEFRVSDSSYDSMYDEESGIFLGHTWKNYYFYYDEKDGQVHEYGGAEIDKKQAEELCKKDIVKEKLKDSDILDEIFYRDNGLVVINFNRPSDGGFNCYHCIYDTRNGCYVDDGRNETTEEYLDGTCHKALCPEIATYPDSFGTGGDVDVVSTEPDKDQPFFGLWVGAFDERDKALDTVKKLEKKGLEAYVVFTPEWETMSKDPFWAVTIGWSGSEPEAQAYIEDAEKAGYKDAYVKYSGERLGHRLYYTLTDPGKVEFNSSMAVLNGVSTEDVAEGSEEGKTRILIIDKKTVFDKTCDMQFFPGHRSGETPLEWINHAEPTDIMGVFDVSTTGDHIDSFYGAYWWD